MKLKSAADLRTFVLTKADIDLINAGKSHLVDRKKISQRELAERAGIHPSFINHLTAGRSTGCTPLRADLISEVLGVDTSILFDEKEPTVSSLKPKRHKVSLSMAS